MPGFDLATLDSISVYLLLASVVLVAIGFAWLSVLAIIAIAKNWRLSRWPLFILLAGLILGAIPFVAGQITGRYASLGPRDRVVDGERHITLTGWDQHDYGVLRRIGDVAVLQMANPDVDDSTLLALDTMPSLRELDVAGSRVSDTGLEAIAKAPKLERLNLSGTRITDAGFRTHLFNHPTLQRVDFTRTAVTPDTIREWISARKGRRAIPMPRPAPAKPSTPESTEPGAAS